MELLGNEVRIRIPYRWLTKPSFYKVYELYCSEFGVLVSAVDRELLEFGWEQGIEGLRKRGFSTIDFRPTMGAKLFVYLREDYITLRGYCDHALPDANERFMTAIDAFFRESQ